MPNKLTDDVGIFAVKAKKSLKDDARILGPSFLSEVGQRLLAPVPVGFAAEGIMLEPGDEIGVVPEVVADPLAVVGIPAQVATERAAKKLVDDRGVFTVGAGLEGIDLTGEMTPEGAGVIARLVTESVAPIERFARLFTARRARIPGIAKTPEELELEKFGVSIGPSKIQPETVTPRELFVPRGREDIPSTEIMPSVEALAGGRKAGGITGEIRDPPVFPIVDPEPIPTELINLRDELVQEKMTFLAQSLREVSEATPTGKLIPTGQGQFRRIGDFKRLFPEIADMSESPGAIGNAIRSGKGKLFEKIRDRFTDEMDAEEVRAASRFLADTEETVLAGADPSALSPISGAENPPPRAANINLNRIDTTDDVKRFIAEVAENNRGTIEESRRGVITFEQTERLADQVGLTAEKLLKRRKGKALNAEEALAARQVLTASAEDTFAAMTRARTGGDAATLDALQALRRHIAIQKQVSGVTAEAGRALGAFRIGATGGPARQRALKVLIESIGGEEKLTKEIIERIASIDPESPTFIRDVNLMIRDISQAKTTDKIFEAWVNAILSGPQTQVTNTVSNTLTAVSRPLLERPTVAILDAVRAAFTGTPRERFFMESASDIFGMIRGLREGTRKGLEAFRTELPSFGLTKLESPLRAQQAIKGPLGRVVRLPGRALVAADEFMKAVNFQGELSALAFRQATKQGLKGRARAARIAEIIRNPNGELVEKATAEAFYRTFTQDLGPTGKSLTRLRDNTPVIRYIVPFMRTPLNIAKFGLERTPLNFLRLAHKVKLGELRGVALVDELAKPVMGSIIGATIASLAAQGLVTGGGPDDPAKRRALRATGWQPYSVRIGDQSISYGRLEPLGMIVGLTADYVELFDATEQEDAVGKITLAISQNLTNKTFLRGVSDFVNAISDPQRFGDRWIQSLAGTVIPTGVAQLARAVDPIFRRPETPREAIESRIPFLSQNVRPLRDIWGRPIIIPETGPERFLSPVRRTPILQDKASNEVVRLGIRPGSPQRKLGKIELSSEEFERYTERAGALARKLVVRITDIPGYDKLPDPVKAKAIRDAFNRARLVARNDVKTGAIKRLIKEEGIQKTRERLSPLPAVPRQ